MGCVPSPGTTAPPTVIGCRRPIGTCATPRFCSPHRLLASSTTTSATRCTCASPRTWPSVSVASCSRCTTCVSSSSRWCLRRAIVDARLLRVPVLQDRARQSDRALRLHPRARGDVGRAWPLGLRAGFDGTRQRGSDVPQAERCHDEDHLHKAIAMIERIDSRGRADIEQNLRQSTFSYLVNARLFLRQTLGSDRAHEATGVAGRRSDRCRFLGHLSSRNIAGFIHLHVAPTRSGPPAMMRGLLGRVRVGGDAERLGRGVAAQDS